MAAALPAVEIMAKRQNTFPSLPKTSVLFGSVMISPLFDKRMMIYKHHGLLLCVFVFIWALVRWKSLQRRFPLCFRLSFHDRFVGLHLFLTLPSLLYVHSMLN